ncbi:MAG: LexA family transcriptional regulator [Planctomycetota bacterium]
METVGQIVRKRREALGLTLQALAEAVGATKGYLSMIENHRVDNPPSRGLLEGLERALGITTGELRRAADWQATPEPIRQQVQRLSDDADRGRELAAWLKASTGAKKKGGAGKDLDALYRSGQLAKRVNAVLNTPAEPSPGKTAIGQPTGAAPVRYRVPLINQVAAGHATEHTDLGYPVGAADTHLDVPDLGTPDCFATRIVGHSMQPGYREGDIVVCSASAKVDDGSDCFVRLEPDHESTFKRVYFDIAARTIRLQPLNPDFPPRTVEREQVAGMYKAVWKFSKV